LIPACEGSNPSSPAINTSAFKSESIEKPPHHKKVRRLFQFSAAFLLDRKNLAKRYSTPAERSPMAHGRANDNLMVFTGNAIPELAAGVAKQLNIELGKAKVSKFSDGEITVEINENVRGKDVFVLQSTCAPTNDNLMEIILMVDALKRASAGRITAAIPYFGYARQDRRPRSARVAISAKVVANMLEKAGVDRVLIMDLHADQVQGFFDIPVDNIYASPILLGDLVSKNYDDLLVVSPDVGGVVRARALAKRLGCVQKRTWRKS
jgi:ribose-phosphate pyrophosphokinase